MSERGDRGGEHQGDVGGSGEDKPKKLAADASPSSAPASRPRKLHMTPKQIEDGPVICGLCRAPFEAPEDDETEEATETFHEIPDQS